MLQRYVSRSPSKTMWEGRNNQHFSNDCCERLLKEVYEQKAINQTFRDILSISTPSSYANVCNRETSRGCNKLRCDDYVESMTSQLAFCNTVYVSGH